MELAIACLDASDRLVSGKRHPQDFQPEIADQGKVGCFIKLSSNTKAHWCVADTIKGLKEQAMANIRTWYPDDTWDDAKLVCYEDGCRMQDMDHLRKCLHKNPTEFYFIGPKAPTANEIALDIERVAELYKELKDGWDDELKIHKWIGYRLKDLQGILRADWRFLSVKLQESPEQVSDYQDRIGEFLLTAPGTGYYNPEFLEN